MSMALNGFARDVFWQGGKPKDKERSRNCTTMIYKNFLKGGFLLLSEIRPAPGMIWKHPDHGRLLAVVAYSLILVNLNHPRILKRFTTREASGITILVHVQRVLKCLGQRRTLEIC